MAVNVRGVFECVNAALPRVLGDDGIRVNTLASRLMLSEGVQQHPQWAKPIRAQTPRCMAMDTRTEPPTTRPRRVYGLAIALCAATRSKKSRFGQASGRRAGASVLSSARHAGSSVQAAQRRRAAKTSGSSPAAAASAGVMPRRCIASPISTAVSWIRVARRQHTNANTAAVTTAPPIAAARSSLFHTSVEYGAGARVQLDADQQPMESRRAYAPNIGTPSCAATLASSVITAGGTGMPSRLRLA